jgi:hypothetical protein
MLPGIITPGLFGGKKPPIIDAATLSLMKFDGAIGASGIGLTFPDYVKPTRVWTNRVAAGTLSNFSKFGTAWFANGGAFANGPASDPDYNCSGDFTIDFWAATTSISGSITGPFVCKTTATSGVGASASYNFWQGGAGLGLYMSSNGTTNDIANGVVITSAGIAASTYFHVALVRSGNTYYVFFNGALTNSWSSTLSPFASSAPPQVGQAFGGDGAAYYLNCWIDELRFSNVARWTASFTPPHAPYYGLLNGGNDAATKFLLHADGANGATAASDSAAGATVAHPITFNGTAKLSTAQAKFGATSLQCDGSANGRLTVPNSADFDWHNSDFTVDFWYRPTTTTGGALVHKRNTSAEIAPFVISDIGSGVIQMYASDNGSGWSIAAPMNIGTAPLNAWTHVALVKTPGILTPYINGVAGATYASGNPLFWLNNNVLSIGGLADTACITGFLDEVRFSDVARWTANFTPPSAAY